MKRLFAVLLIVCLTFTAASAVFAEDMGPFSLRGGITFGMSSSEVFAIEGKAGWVYTELTDGTESIRRYRSSGNVAGCSDGRIFLTFLDDRLVQIVYSLETGDDIQYLRTCFDTREKTLTQKYGKAEYASDTGRKMEEIKLTKYHRYIFSHNNDYYSERKLLFNGQTICIDHFVDYVDMLPELSCVEVVYTLYPGDSSLYESSLDNDL